MKAFGSILAVFVAFALGAQAQVTIDWDFSGGGGSGAPNPTLPPNISGGTLFGTNEYPGNNPGFNSANQSGGYPGASGNHNASIAIQSGSLDPLASTYFEFALTPASGYQLTATDLQFGTFSKGNGPQTITLLASVDGFTTFTTLGSATGLPTTSTWTLVALSSFSFSAAADVPITFRLYGSDGIGGSVSSNWRIDDVSLSITATAVPEPSTFMALLVGGAVLGVRAWRRRKPAVG